TLLPPTLYIHPLACVLTFDFLRCARFVLGVTFLRDRIAGCRAAGGAFRASRAWLGGFGNMGGGAEELADVCKPAPDLAWGQGASGWRPGFPGAAQVCGMRPGQR